MVKVCIALFQAQLQALFEVETPEYIQSQIYYQFQCRIRYHSPQINSTQFHTQIE